MDHWTKLRAALKTRGIDHLGAKSGEELAENIKIEFAGGKPSYDPLMDCNNMIFSRGLEMGGLYLLTAKEDGAFHCPICEAIKHMHARTVEEQEKYWIDGPADAALGHCRKLGLVPVVQ